MSLYEHLKRAPPAEPLPDEQVAGAYRRYRIRVFVAVYLGYSLYYIVRKNIAAAMPVLMDDLSLEKAQMGVVLSLFSATYALAKLINGPLCDRSNPRYFMALGLGASAVVNVVFGLGSSLVFFAGLWMLNGYFQSMGSPIGPKTMANWFSAGERGLYYGVWNTCHNFGAFLILVAGGFLVEHLGWRSGFLLPGALCLLGGGFVAWKMMDRPESAGLPSIQEYHGEVERGVSLDTDETAAQILSRYVLKNPRLWVLGAACGLVYMVRYGLGDWGVTYLNEMKGSSVGWASFKSSFLELMGIPGTILAGLMADRFFKGRNLVVAMIYAAGTGLSVLAILYVPKGYGTLDAAAFGLSGFFIYGAQMVCTGLAPLELVPRRAVASAVGLTGAMSYGGAVLTSTLSGWITDAWGWTWTFWFWVGCAALAVAIMAALVMTTGNTRGKRTEA